MNFKDAFHYQNTLECLFNNATVYLRRTDNVTKITREHMRSKADSTAQDETIDATEQRRPDAISYPVPFIVNFLCAVMDEKIALTMAIEKAKRSSSVMLDAEIAANKMRQYAHCVIFDLGRFRNKTITTYDVDYRINAEGNQVQYRYPVKETVVPDFDTGEMRKISSAMRTAQNEASQRIEKMMLETEIEFTPSFDVDDEDLHSAIEAFAYRHGGGDHPDGTGRSDGEESAYERRYLRHAV